MTPYEMHLQIMQSVSIYFVLGLLLDTRRVTEIKDKNSCPEGAFNLIKNANLNEVTENNSGQYK